MKKRPPSQTASSVFRSAVIRMRGKYSDFRYGRAIAVPPVVDVLVSVSVSVSGSITGSTFDVGFGIGFAIVEEIHVSSPSFFSNRCSKTV